MRVKIGLTLFAILIVMAFKERLPLSVQIVGAWVGPETTDSTDLVSGYKLVFFPFGTAFIKMIFSDGRIEKLAFSFSVEEKTGTIRLQGRLITEFQAKMVNDQLHITNSIWETPREGIYIRTLASRVFFLFCDHRLDRIPGLGF